MEIGDSVVMLQQILPDSQGMAPFAVEGPVYKFYLRHLMVQEEIQLPLYQLQAAKPHRPVNGRQTIATSIRAASAALIVENPVFHSV